MAKTNENIRKKTNQPQKEKKVKAIKSTKAELTAQQRIRRLKRKIASNELTSSQSSKQSFSGESTLATGPNHMKPSYATLDEYFVENDGHLAPIAKTIDPITIESENGNSSESENYPKGNTQISANVQNCDSTDIRSMLASINTKFDDMNGEISALRRQVARIEAKSSIHCKQNIAHPANELDESVFLDFESTLAAEGLPIKSVDGVNALENRLKETAFSAMPYRQKLVRRSIDMFKM